RRAPSSVTSARSSPRCTSWTRRSTAAACWRFSRTSATCGRPELAPRRPKVERHPDGMTRSGAIVGIGPAAQRRSTGGAAVTLLADWSFLDVMWSFFIFFAWVIWIYLVILVLADNFRRQDHSGWAKAGWTLLVIFLPLVGVLAYMITAPKHED